MDIPHAMVLAVTEPQAALVLAGLVALLGVVLWFVARHRQHQAEPTAASDRLLVVCHFCHGSQRIYASDKNQWWCSSSGCGQWNGFTATGDYNRDLCEMYDETLNARPRARGVYVEPASVLCARCQGAQEAWLAKGGRDRLEEPALCPSCAFDVGEALKVSAGREFLGAPLFKWVQNRYRTVKMSYLGTTIQSSRAAGPVEGAARFPRRASVALVALLCAVTAALQRMQVVPWLWMATAGLAVFFNRWLAARDALCWSSGPLEVCVSLLAVHGAMDEHPVELVWMAGALGAGYVLRREWIEWRRVSSVPPSASLPPEDRMATIVPTAPAVDAVSTAAAVPTEQEAWRARAAQPIFDWKGVADPAAMVVGGRRDADDDAMVTSLLGG